MGGNDSNYQIIYRGEQLERWTPGGWVIFQLPKECGGGFWLGRTYEDCFWFEFDRPTSLGDALSYLITVNSVSARSDTFDDDFELTP